MAIRVGIGDQGGYQIVPKEGLLSLLRTKANGFRKRVSV